MNHIFKRFTRVAWDKNTIIMSRRCGREHHADSRLVIRKWII